MNKYKCFPVDYISITGGYNNGHQATDFGWWGDTSDRPIYSVSDGTVLEVRNNYKTKDATGNSYGNYVLIQNEDGSKSTYCHLKYGSVLVNVGEKVTLHKHIATMGETGRTTAPHLHYEHRINNVKVNPLDYLYCYTSFQYINESKPDSKYIKIKPTSEDIVVGSHVITTGTGNASSYGDGGSAKTGLEGYVTRIIEGRPYPYLVNEDGWYKKEDLQLI